MAPSPPKRLRKSDPDVGPNISSLKSPEATVFHLDDIVLTRCCSLLLFADRLRFELVSRRLSVLVRAVDDLEKMTLTLRVFRAKRKMKRIELETAFEMGQAADDTRCHLILSARRLTGTKKVAVKKMDLDYMYENDIIPALKSVLKRFSQFHCLHLFDGSARYNNSHYDTLYGLFMDVKFRLAAVHRIKFEGHSERSDWTFMKSFCSTLKEINLTCLMPHDKEESELLWNAVLMCKNLRKLTYSPWRWHGLSIPQNSHSNDLMRFCLQKLSITHFRGENLDDSYDEAWLRDCFGNNKNLRSLVINQTVRVLRNKSASSKET